MITANLKYLRKQTGKSQEEVSQDLMMKRTTLSGYENGSAEPSLDNLLKLAEYYKVSVDQMIRKPLEQLGFQPGLDKDWISGTKLRVVTTAVDHHNNEFVELVPVKARAGYTSGYADPDYIRVLPTFHMPFLASGKKYRTFPIVGDSMPPVADGSWVTGEYLDNWNFIKDGQPYIIVTQDEGIVFKTVFNHIHNDGTLLLCSTNPFYEPYSISVDAVCEVWKFTHYISSELPEPNLSKSEINATVMNLQREVSLLKNTMKRK
jgi:transcriptional regulator with XRE-family HTH domain